MSKTLHNAAINLINTTLMNNPTLSGLDAAERQLLAHAIALTGHLPEPRVVVEAPEHIYLIFGLTGPEGDKTTTHHGAYEDPLDALNDVSAIMAGLPGDPFIPDFSHETWATPDPQWVWPTIWTSANGDAFKIERVSLHPKRCKP